jgi:5-(carboxyamino)imidazole ribonucleotide synthase
VTYEFENVPAATAAACAEFTPLRPGPQVLAHRPKPAARKTLLCRTGLARRRRSWRLIRWIDLLAGLETIGIPAILKTASSGYDGKGQVKIVNRQSSIVNRQWEAIGRQPAILEGFVEFEREVSVVAARGVDGAFAHFGLIENSHANHILDVSVAPAAAPPEVATRSGRHGAHRH